MSRKFFITGTDTGIGKTYTSVGLIKIFKAWGFSVVGLKPISTGASYINGELVNDDAILLQKNSSFNIGYKLVNPFCYLPPVSPNIADPNLSIEAIASKIQEIFSYQADVYIIEGAGGWHTPINFKHSLADLVALLDIPVIVTVGLRLGCLNHAILTTRAIQNQGLVLKGWVANVIDQTMHALTENIDTLKKYINAPCLGVIQPNQPPEQILNINFLL